MIKPVKAWTRKGIKQIADCRIFTVHESISVSPETEEQHKFYVMETADWVNVVPVTASNELVCIRQYRHGSEEEPIVSAARECLEETGYEANELISLGVLNPNPAIFGNRLHTFVAPNVTSLAEISNTSTERTEVQLIPMEQVADFLVSGEIDHALVTATLWRMLYFLKK
jgi:8-oxo-dGTP pyrophosphatase MutT (NUDIX family)